MKYWATGQISIFGCFEYMVRESDKKLQDVRGYPLVMLASEGGGGVKQILTFAFFSEMLTVSC